MFKCDRKLLIGLCVIFVLELTTECVILVKVFYNLKVIPPEMSALLPQRVLQQVTGCVPFFVEPYAWTYWIPVLVIESILFSLSLMKLVQQWRIDATSPYLMQVLLRDSVLYFGGALSAILTNFFVWKLKAETLFFVFIPVVMVLNSILGGRLLVPFI